MLELHVVAVEEHRRPRQLMAVTAIDLLRNSTS